LKITDRYRQRCAVVYVRQSTPGQVDPNIDYAARQKGLAEARVELGGQLLEIVAPAAGDQDAPVGY
jgi:hypothetical protein